MIDHDKEDYPRPAGPVGANLDWLLAWLERPTRALGVGTTGSPLESQPGPDPRQIDRLRSAVRFVRSDGSLIFGARVKSKPRLVELERWVRRVGDSELAQVLSGWVPRSSLGNDFTVGPSPLATETWRDRPLAILRTDWTARGDYLAIDHREVGTESTVEVAGRGVSWLGPRWGSPTLAGSDARVEPTFAVSGPFADAYEWSFQVGPARVTRSAILVRVRGLAILMQTEQGASGAISEARWSLPAGVEASSDPSSRALILRSGRGRPAARLVPLGLPEANYPTERGSLTVEGREVVLRQASPAPDRTLALLVAWDKQPPLGWRTLTVAEKSAVCPSGTAFAARVGWGVKHDGLLIYRSIGSSGLRSVLGHQTKARLLVAAFTPRGEVRPWIKANDPRPPRDQD